MKQASLKLLRMFIAAALVICLCFTVAIAAVGSAEQNSPEPAAPAAVSASEAADDAVDAAPSECLPDENADPVLFSWERSTKAMLLLENGPLKMRGYKTVEGHHASYTCPIYPDFYGGAYFEPDKDTLYVYLTDISMRSKLEKTLGEYKDCVIFLEAELNLNELLSLAQNTACLLSAAGYEVLTYGTDEINHKAAIDVFHEDYEAAKAYLEASGIEHLDFITLDCMYGKPILFPGEVHESARLPYEFDDIEREETKSTTSLCGGIKLWDSTYSGYFSLGVCGKYNGYNAFITCGHGLNNGDPIRYDLGGRTVGTIVKNVFQNGGIGDYSIVKINNNLFSPTYNVRNIPMYKAYTATNHNGQTVTVKGSNHLNGKGRVVKSNVAVDYDMGNNIYYTVNGLNIVNTTSGRAFHGDSGGACINDNNTFYGVLSGGIDNGSTTINFFYSPIHLAMNAGFSLYPHPHSYAYVDYNATYHKCTCTLCGFYVLQKHSDTWDSSNNRCFVCGHS